ncbi:MAG: DNA repair protein RecO [Candidatus Hydrogenedentota bacterium]
MTYIKSEGFVLRTQPYKEGDRLVTLYTLENGLLHCIAKGSRKLKSRTCSLLQPYYKNFFVLYRSPNRELFTITQASAINPHNALREDIKKYTIVCAMTEVLVNYLEAEEKDTFLYHLLEHCITRLEANDEPKTLFRIFEFRFIAHSGYMFQLHYCVCCKRYIKRPELFSVKRGGIICQKCVKEREIIRIGPGTLSFLEKVFREPLKNLVRFKLGGSTERIIDKISQFTHKFYTGKKINSVEFLTCIK